MYKVLIADDEEFIRERIINNMPWGEIGFEVAGCASDGELALKMARECHPDVILTDILMPNMTGLELAQCLKSEFPHIKVALMSAYDDFQYAKEAIRFGVKGYLLKPILRDEFVELFQGVANDLKNEGGQHVVQTARPAFVKATSDRNSYISLAKQYIAANYTERIRLEDVSERLHVNPNYFSTLFKRETGKNFIDYLNEVRINESMKLLRHTDYKVFEISMSVGYGNFSYFNKIFKRISGVTPQTYRESGGSVFQSKEGV
ncbi:response regulator [Paenibacillus sp. HWE-109]|uniref:response regulator transcription factor n=1 Tax=Paenibacillus sp. HWE-109 TaxID=1306526 RepID=UPI001EE11382|nr:response regulator [Paenibacillus sp. HWE-109]UKS27903.1 response regulator [Paenibacillus sp. HWE-109]